MNVEWNAPPVNEKLHKPTRCCPKDTLITPHPPSSRTKHSAMRDPEPQTQTSPPHWIPDPHSVPSGMTARAPQTTRSSTSLPSSSRTSAVRCGTQCPKHKHLRWIPDLHFAPSGMTAAEQAKRLHTSPPSSRTRCGIQNTNGGCTKIRLNCRLNQQDGIYSLMRSPR